MSPVPWRPRRGEGSVRVERSRLSFLAGAAAFVAGSRLAAGDRTGAAAAPEVVVYKSPTCGCCTEWVVHLRRHGFRGRPEDVTNLQAVKARRRVPPDLQSCHTALGDGFVMEGHVPADLVERLLRERPKVMGLAVPGMPVGSPGMEVQGARAERYRVLTFDRDGKTEVFASR
jgi:hypothetical protein